jgi:caffeoyl-CoA O-methyltransferase
VAPRSFHLTPELQDYVVAHSAGPDPVAERLIARTREEVGDFAGMQIAPDQGALMTILTQVIGARRAVEVGTFTGYSALCIARGLPDDGHLLCCDVSEEWTAIGRDAWAAAGVDHKIDLRIAPALETLRALPDEPTIDLAFIDADKPSYVDYHEALVPRLRPNGLLLVDNVLWDGRVVDGDASDENTEAIRAYNDRAARDERVEGVIVSIGDGLSVFRRR